MAQGVAEYVKTFLVMNLEEVDSLAWSGFGKQDFSHWIGSRDGLRHPINEPHFVFNLLSSISKSRTFWTTSILPSYILLCLSKIPFLLIYIASICQTHLGTLGASSHGIMIRRILLQWVALLGGL
jgi:hypothetical protein